jgi:hypothetical protein
MPENKIEKKLENQKFKIHAKKNISFQGTRNFHLIRLKERVFFLNKQALSLTKCNLIIFFYGGITKFELTVHSCSNFCCVDSPTSVYLSSVRLL